MIQKKRDEGWMDEGLKKKCVVNERQPFKPKGYWLEGKMSHMCMMCAHTFPSFQGNMRKYHMCMQV